MKLKKNWVYCEQLPREQSIPKGYGFYRTKISPHRRTFVRLPFNLILRLLYVIFSFVRLPFITYHRKLRLRISHTEEVLVLYHDIIYTALPQAVNALNKKYEENNIGARKCVDSVVTECNNLPKVIESRASEDARKTVSEIVEQARQHEATVRTQKSGGPPTPAQQLGAIISGIFSPPDTTVETKNDKN